MNSNDSILGFLLVTLFTLELLRAASAQDQVMIEGSIKFIDRESSIISTNAETFLCRLDAKELFSL